MVEHDSKKKSKTNDDPQVFVPLGRNPEIMKIIRSRGTAPSCQSVPTTADKVSQTSYTLDTDVAGKLGITYIGTGNASIDQTMKVFVREFARYSTCESTDGKATLQYGAVWRATVLIDSTAASGSVNFAIVAASATLKNVAVQVSIISQGFTDQTNIDQKSQAAMADTASGLDVTSFGKFSQDVESAIAIAVASQVKAPLELIGIITHDTGALLDAVATAFALAYIAKGRGCLDPIKDFPVHTNEIEQVIRSTYDALSNTPCDASDQLTQIAAQRLLNGIKISD
jgi:hypothetical protein